LRIVVLPDDKTAIPIALRSWTGGRWVLDSDPSIYFQTNNLPGDNNHTDLIEGACGGVDGSGNPLTMGHPIIIQRNYLNAEGLCQAIKMEYGAYYTFRNNICIRHTYIGAPVVVTQGGTIGEQLIYGNTILDESSYIHGLLVANPTTRVFNNIISGAWSNSSPTANNNIWFDPMSNVSVGMRGSNDIYGVSPYDLFVDYHNDDFRLKAGAVAIDYADPNYTDWTDYTGVAGIRKTGIGPDVGAYEYGASTFLYGDVSGNKEISAYDAALTAQYAVALITLTPDQIKAADVSGNGEVSAYDAALIAQKAVGLIEKFPVEG